MPPLGTPISSYFFCVESSLDGYRPLPLLITNGDAL